MSWYYHNTPQQFEEEDIGDAFGFVYIITHNQTGRKYIGKKYFTKAGTKQVKGKKKKIRKTSDWADYWGSNEELKKEIQLNGKEQYTREIMYLCKSRSECSYWETFEIFNRHALLSDSYYNSWVTCKIHKSHVLGKINGSQDSKYGNNFNNSSQDKQSPQTED
jgi:hypothetical protein